MSGMQHGIGNARWRNQPECANQECQFRSPLRKFMPWRNREGVVLQGQWYCSLDCFERAITGVFSGLLKLDDSRPPHLHRVPLGLLLLGRGVINQDQLKAGLMAQRETSHDRLGRCLVRLGAVLPHDVSEALAAQWGCAVFPLDQDSRYRDCSQMIPFALLESSYMLPVHFVPESNLLFLAFAEDIDHTSLYWIERLIGVRAEPCVVTESAMQNAMEEIRGLSRPGEIVFERVWDASEMARTVRGYAVELGAEELVMARPRHFLWVRLRSSGRSLDLMFRLPTHRFI